MQSIERFLRKLWRYPVKFVSRYTASSIVGIIIIFVLMVTFSDSCSCAKVIDKTTGLIDLSYNYISQDEANVIAENLRCAWSKRYKMCVCIYANSGTIGGYVPNRICGKE